MITALSKRADFRNQPFFFRVTGLYARGKQSPETTVDGEYRLGAGKSYFVSILHWLPKGDGYEIPKDSGLLNVNVGSSDLHSVTAPRLPVDSPYDLKSFHFVASGTIKTN